MTQTKTDTRAPIFAETIVEMQQPTSTRTFTELLQGRITTLQPPPNDTNSIAVAADLASVSVPLSASVIASQPPAHDLAPTLMPNSASNPTNPFAICQQPLTNATPQPVQWLWQQRLPLAGITLLDGDHGTGKTLLAHQIAAAVSSGSPMPDGTPTIRGGVIIITPNTDPSTTQLQHLINLGADLSRIKILSFIHDPASTPHPSGNRPFSLPEDLPLLFDTIDQLDARLIILDPFIHMLSRQRPCTTRHLNCLLADLNQRLIERNVACLLIRNCPARGGHARPSALEHSDDFPTIAVSRLLLAPDPIQPDRILLSHALSRHTALTQTLTLHIQSLPTNPNLAHITIQGTHHLTANHLLTHSPDTLHRHLLSQHLYTIIATATEPIATTTLSAQSPHSSPFQFHRSLKDLLQTGQILCPTRGFYTLNPYTLNPTTPTQLKATGAMTPTLPETAKLKATGAITPSLPETAKLNVTGATTSAPTIVPKLKATGAPTSTLPETAKLKATGTITPALTETAKLKATGAITSALTIVPKLKATGATTSTLPETAKLKATGAITPTPTIATNLKATGAITSASTEVPKLDTPGAITSSLTAVSKLKATGAITPVLPETPKLDVTSAITSAPIKVPKLDVTGAITSAPIEISKLKATGAITPTPTNPIKLDSPATTIPNPTIPTKLDVTAAITPTTRASRPHYHPHKQKKCHGRPGQSKKRS